MPGRMRVRCRLVMPWSDSRLFERKFILLETKMDL
jgi:hypothetical protein